MYRCRTVFVDQVIGVDNVYGNGLNTGICYCSKSIVSLHIACLKWGLARGLRQRARTLSPSVVTRRFAKARRYSTNINSSNIVIELHLPAHFYHVRSCYANVNLHNYTPTKIIK